jgi:hypothetical protein
MMGCYFSSYQPLDPAPQPKIPKQLTRGLGKDQTIHLGTGEHLNLLSTVLAWTKMNRVQASLAGAAPGFLFMATAIGFIIHAPRLMTLRLTEIAYSVHGTQYTREVPDYWVSPRNRANLSGFITIRLIGELLPLRRPIIGRLCNTAEVRQVSPQFIPDAPEDGHALSVRTLTRRRRIVEATMQPFSLSEEHRAGFFGVIANGYDVIEVLPVEFFDGL